MSRRIKNVAGIILWFGLAILISLLWNGLDVYYNYKAMSLNGNQDVLWYGMYLHLLPLVIALVLIPVFLFGMLIIKTIRKRCFMLVVTCVLYVCVAIFCFWVGDEVRMHGFYKLAERSEPLITAIEKYELQNSHPPANLQDIVPDFMPEIPYTGIGAYPKYKYIVGDESQKFSNNPWSLIVDAGFGVHLDIFLYLPNQKYNELDYGNSFEKIKDWAYVYD